MWGNRRYHGTPFPGAYEVVDTKNNQHILCVYHCLLEKWKEQQESGSGRYSQRQAFRGRAQTCMFRAGPQVDQLILQFIPDLHSIVTLTLTCKHWLAIVATYHAAHRDTDWLWNLWCTDRVVEVPRQLVTKGPYVPTAGRCVKGQSGRDYVKVCKKEGFHTRCVRLRTPLKRLARCMTCFHQKAHQDKELYSQLINWLAKYAIASSATSSVATTLMTGVQSKKRKNCDKAYKVKRQVQVAAPRVDPDFLLPFGLHKGFSLRHVYEKTWSYYDWMVKNLQRDEFYPIYITTWNFLESRPKHELGHDSMFGK